MAHSKLTQRIYMVTGKGGVGKSVIAAALAKTIAKSGRRVLLAEIGDQSYYADALGIPLTVQKPMSWLPGLDVVLWSGEGCLREYILHLVKIEKLANLFFDNKVMRTFLKASPALREISILGKLTSGIRRVGPQLNYDAIVLDAYSTGHYLALLNSPRGLSELVDKGPMAEQTKEILNILSSEVYTKHIVVTLPEELPAQEAKELYNGIKNLLSARPVVVCNKVYNIKLDTKKLEQYMTVDDENQKFAQFLLGKINKENRSLQILNDEKIKSIHVPQYFSVKTSEIIDFVSSFLGPLV